MPEKIYQVHSGLRTVACWHPQKPYTVREINKMTDAELLADVKPRLTYVNLVEIPDEVGWHGTCPDCNQRYFSLPKDTL